MRLYQRVRRIAVEFAGSETKLAQQLGIQQRTLNGYLNESREENLFPSLSRILELYPQISRDWLYFGEGEMLHSPARPLEQPAAPGGSMEMMERENAMLRELLAAHKRENAALREVISAHARENETLRELARSKDDFIELQKQLLAQTSAGTVRDESDEGINFEDTIPAATSVRGSTVAAHLSRRGTDPQG